MDEGRPKDNFPEIILKLTAKGIYIWSISLPLKDGEEAKAAVDRLKKFNAELQNAFPAHAKLGTGRVANVDLFADND